MIFFSTALTWLGALAGYVLVPFMLLLILRRRLYLRLMFFTAYLSLLLIWSPTLAWVSVTPFYSSLAWFYTYWIVEFALAVLRLLTIAEISRRFLKNYPAIWELTAWILAGVTIVLLLWTANSAIHNVHHIRRFILLGDERFEFLQAVLLIALLLIGAYYRIKLPTLYLLVLLGIGIYSSIQVANNPIGVHQVILPNSTFDYVRRGAIIVALGIWTYAIWQQSAAPEQKPELISVAIYDRLSPEIHGRLQELNDKLAEVLRRPR